ncbi:MAG: hypothetical protein GC191_15510 [Azospirillum sp.]|nr:hypothetical protein [Azospirillum sp.]
MLSPLVKKELGRIAAMVAVAAVGGGLYGMAAARISLTDGLINGISDGALIGFALSVFEGLLLNSKFGEAVERQPLILIIGLRILVYGAVILAVLAEVWDSTGRSLAVLIHDPSFIRAVWFSFGFATAINFVMTVYRLLGRRALINFLLGRYSYAREENRFLLFVDLTGSTALAERLGNLGYHRFLRSFMGDVSAAVAATRGEIHEFVGDGVVITWPAETGARQARPLRCVFAIADRIAARQDRYVRGFGDIPRFRAGLHLGVVVAGEMGTFRRQIVLIGEAMNTAARIEQASRSLGRPILASRPALDALALPPDLVAQSLGPIALRGKAGAVELFAIDRR